MISTSRPMWLLSLLVLVVLVQAQDADPPPGDTKGGADDDASADAKAAGSGDCECEEAWEYVDFLKKEVNEKVTTMLTEDFKEPGDEIVADTMEKVMEIRKTLLVRIKDIRKKKVEICEYQDIQQEEKLTDFRMEVMEILLMLVDSNAEENLKEISNKLLDFRRTINTEVMRLLMLPQPDCDDKPVKPKDIKDCEPLTELSFNLTDIKLCASKDPEDADDGADATTDAPDAAADGEDPKPGEKCETPPNMYTMSLIMANEELDGAIESLYTKIIQEIDEEERTKLRDMLTMLKDFREDIDDVIIKLLPLDEDEAIKKEASKSLGGLIRKIDAKLGNCKSCDSCAKEILEEAIQKMADYLDSLGTDRDDESKKEFVRSDVISYINKNTEKARALTKKKIENDGKLSKCEKEELDTFDKLKPPMWMLVNYTIFRDVGEVTDMITAMDEELKRKLGAVCEKPTTPKPQTDDDSGCEWDEYENTKDYLEAVDDTIQNQIFKGNDKSKILLGFLQIQEMFDKRVKKLFEEGVQCPEELTNIKTIYMKKLTECMTEFMNPNLEFETLKRQQRILCIKELRSEMEGRSANLLQFELEKSLSGLDGSGFGK